MPIALTHKQAEDLFSARMHGIEADQFQTIKNVKNLDIHSLNTLNEILGRIDPTQVKRRIAA